MHRPSPPCLQDLHVQHKRVARSLTALCETRCIRYTKHVHRHRFFGMFQLPTLKLSVRPYAIY